MIPSLISMETLKHLVSILIGVVSCPNSLLRKIVCVNEYPQFGQKSLISHAWPSRCLTSMDSVCIPSRLTNLAMLTRIFAGLDKATQITVDALGDFSESLRECARSVGKENFFIPGEITGGNTFGSKYLGRGRQPNMVLENVTVATQMTNVSNSSIFIRDIGKNAWTVRPFIIRYIVLSLDFWEWMVPCLLVSIFQSTG